jgi:tetratricopeptide (TPR) repeat protein
MAEPSEGKAMIEEALAINRKLLGNENIEVVNCLIGLIPIVSRTGTLAETEKMLRQVLEMQKRLLGREHRDVAGSLAGLASVQADKGELAEAEDTARAALAMQRRLLGERHPDISDSLGNLADILFRRGKLAEAESAAREGLKMYETLLGKDELDLPTGSWDALTDILRAEGKLAVESTLAYERMAKRDLYLTEKLSSQPRELHFLYRRGTLRGQMGRWREATADLSKAVELGSDYHHNFVDLAERRRDGHYDDQGLSHSPFPWLCGLSHRQILHDRHDRSLAPAGHLA